jgi:hypothetical protein
MCRVYGRIEAVSPPLPEQYSFGTFVTLAPVEGTDVTLVGVIRDTILVNPEYGALGPRLSSERELAVFSPDYLDEKGTVVEVLVVGWRDRSGTHHGVPALAAQVGTRVETMSKTDVRAFHTDSLGRFLVGYLPAMLMKNDAMTTGLLYSILEQLEPDFPQQERVIAVLKNNLAWKARVAPAG